MPHKRLGERDVAGAGVDQRIPHRQFRGDMAARVSKLVKQLHRVPESLIPRSAVSTRIFARMGRVVLPVNLAVGPEPARLDKRTRVMLVGLHVLRLASNPLLPSIEAQALEALLRASASCYRCYRIALVSGHRW